MTRTKSTFLALAAVLLSPMAVNADPIEVTFSEGTNSGTFTYDDSELTNGTGNPFQQGGISYDALGFTLNGAVQTGPFYVEIFNNFSNGYDIVYFTAGSASPDASPLLQLACGTDCLADASLSQLTGMSLASFGGPSAVNSIYLEGYAGFGGGTQLESLTISVRQPVPEPGTLALFGIGLFGVGLSRRRKKV